MHEFCVYDAWEECVDFIDEIIKFWGKRMEEGLEEKSEIL